MSIVFIFAVICFCMGIVTAVTKANTILSSTDWLLTSIAIIVVFARFG